MCMCLFSPGVREFSRGPRGEQTPPAGAHARRTRACSALTRVQRTHRNGKNHPPCALAALPWLVAADSTDEELLPPRRPTVAKATDHLLKAADGLPPLARGGRPSADLLQRRETICSLRKKYNIKKTYKTQNAEGGCKGANRQMHFCLI